MKWFLKIGIIVLSILISVFCNPVSENVRYPGVEETTLNFSSLPEGSIPAVFTVGKVTGIRIYDEIKRAGNSLFCVGRNEVPVGAGNWKDAAVMLLFSQFSCNLTAITTEVHGHGNEARLIATQKDGTTQMAVCPGDKRVLTLSAGKDNPFIWAILSGREAEWLYFQLK